VPEDILVTLESDIHCWRRLQSSDLQTPAAPASTRLPWSNQVNTCTLRMLTSSNRSLSRANLRFVHMRMELFWTILKRDPQKAGET
jgi:hypothetical protein